MKGSIIGSFRKYYTEVKEIIDLLENIGILVLSPKKSNVINPDEEFVLFETDHKNHTPVEIQLIALHRILRFDFVYVFSPNGYIGRTTSYEIGRVVERKLPLYFSESPKDLPLFIPSNSIWSPKEFVKYLSTNNKLPKLSVANSNGLAEKLHIDLFLNNYYE